MSTNRIKTLAKDVLSKGYNFRFQAKGNSMRPLIRDGDYLVVRPVNHLKAGDIVLFISADNRLVVHRINKIRNNSIITKGDAVRGQDSPIRRKDVLGEVIIIERGNGRINLEKGFWKLINLMWARIHPFFLLFRAAVRKEVIGLPL